MLSLLLWGTYLGGWRIIRTLGKGIVEVDTPQGVAADGASAAIILTSSHSVWLCRPLTWRPARFWVVVWVVRALRFAGPLLVA